MVYDSLLIERKREVTWVKINRMEQRNSLDKKTQNELVQVFNELETCTTTKVIVITGMGGKIFAGGADVKQLSIRTVTETLEPGIQKTFNVIENSSKVTIAFVNGFALGGGFELALACDIRVGSENAKVGFPELNLGIIPGGGGTQRLTKIVGEGRALDLILTGDILSAKEAEDIGILKNIIKDNDIETYFNDFLFKIKSKSPLAIKLAKLAIKKGNGTSADTAMLIEKLAQTIAFATEDKTEGINAFLEKRKPEFKGK